MFKPSLLSQRCMDFKCAVRALPDCRGFTKVTSRPSGSLTKAHFGETAVVYAFYISMQIPSYLKQPVGALSPFHPSRLVRSAPLRVQAMASEACCSAGKPVQIQYDAKGKLDKVGDLPIYRSGTGPLGVVIIPDIFGFVEKQVFQVCDRFADAGFNVCAIDPFHGHPWTLAKFPPKPEDNFMGWISSVGSWERLQPDIAAAVGVLRADGATKLGCIGFCWGVSIALHAGQDAATFSGVGGAHPALFGHDKELAEKVACPVVLLPAKGDASTDVFKHSLDKRPYGSKCVYQRFDDQTHGFVAARGDWSQPEVATAAGKAIHLMTHFLKDAMGAKV